MLVTVKYLVDHASNKKGTEKKMPESTALALEKHKVLKVTSEKTEK